MTTIYLIRHCEYENPEKVVPFRLPGFPLNDEGKERARQIASYFKHKKIAAVYSSPILRTKQTAEIVASELNLKVFISSFLKETRTPLQGIKKEKLYEMQGGDGVFRLEDHIKGGGETIKEVNSRMKKFVGKLLKKHSGEKVIVASHGDPIMIYTNLFTGKEVKGLWESEDYIPLGGIFKLVFDEEGKLSSHTRVNY